MRESAKMIRSDVRKSSDISRGSDYFARLGTAFNVPLA
jgi:hypothetical protein